MTTAIRHFSRNEFQEKADQINGERLPNRPEQGIRVASAVQNYVIGTRRVFGGGLEVFRYGQAGGANCILGQLQQSPVPDGTNINLVPVAPVANYVIGVRVIGVTLGAGGAGANEYVGGWIYVDTPAGLGECLRILSHPTVVGANPCLFTCLDALTINFDATTRCTLVANPYNGVIIHPSPPTAALVGIPKVTIPTTEFGWFQRRGPAAAEIGTVPPVINDLVTASALDDGAVDQYIFGTALGIVGEVIRTDATGEVGMINLMLE